MRRAENLGAADSSVTEIWLPRWLARKLSARADASAVQPGAVGDQQVERPERGQRGGRVTSTTRTR